MTHDETGYDKDPAGDTTPASQPDEPLVFTLVKKEKPFDLTVEDGSVHKYKLVELDGAQRDQWLTAQAQKVKYSEKGTPAGVSSLMGIQASLLSLAVRDGANARVPEAKIQLWPASVLNRLFELAQKMNGLDKAGMDEAKKA